MEPIRPDDDELRATRGSNTGKPREKKPEKAPATPAKAAPGNGGKRGDGGNGGSGGRKSSGPLLLFALLIVAGAGALGWYQQNDLIAQMESQVEEADYWARQSKLALARFEGELTDTGEDLQEAGQSIEQRLDAQTRRLDNADSEIRKLWGVANDRNKARLNEHDERLKALDQSIREAGSGRQALSAGLNELERALESGLDGLESSVGQKLAAQQERLASQQSTLDKLQTSLASVDDQIENRLKRFQREQNLTIDGLEGRISSLEKTTEALSGGEIRAIRAELTTLKQTVSSIDASRAQLTSRLVRLSEEVSQLRSRPVGQ
jgi:chromosome segregation ATPase